MNHESSKSPDVFRIDGVQLRFIAFGLAGSSF